MTRKANNTHPDFTRTLSTKQLAWCEANGICVANGSVVGFFFGKGEYFIEPVKATDTAVYLCRRSSSECSDGQETVETFPRLRDALKALLEAAR